MLSLATTMRMTTSSPMLDRLTMKEPSFIETVADFGVQFIVVDPIILSEVAETNVGPHAMRHHFQRGMRLDACLEVVCMAHQPVNHLGPARIATSTPLKPKFEGVVSTSTLKRVAAQIIEFSIAVEEVVGDVGVVA